MVVNACYSTLTKELCVIIKAEINQVKLCTQLHVKLMFDN